MTNPKNPGVPGHTKYLGARLLAYILNIDEEQSEQMLQYGGPLTSQQQATLKDMEGILARVKQERARNMVLQRSDAERLAELKGPDGNSIFNSLRVINGGDLSKGQHDDPVKNTLSEMCVQCFPTTLIPRTHDAPDYEHIALPRFQGTVQFENFISAVRMDAEIMKLFPDGNDNDLDHSRGFVTSFGSGGSVQLCLLHENILRSAVALMHSRMESSISAFQGAACEMVDNLRAAVSGRSVKIPVFQTFNSIILPEGCEIPLKSSRLLGIPRLFLRHIPRAAYPAAVSKNSPIAGCMLKMDCDFNVKFFSQRH